MQSPCCTKAQSVRLLATAQLVLLRPRPITHGTAPAEKVGSEESNHEIPFLHVGQQQDQELGRVDSEQRPDEWESEAVAEQAASADPDSLVSEASLVSPAVIVHGGDGCLQ